MTKKININFIGDEEDASPFCPPPEDASESFYTPLDNEFMYSVNTTFEEVKQNAPVEKQFINYNNFLEKFPKCDINEYIKFNDKLEKEASSINHINMRESYRIFRKFEKLLCFSSENQVDYFKKQGIIDYKFNIDSNLLIKINTNKEILKTINDYIEELPIEKEFKQISIQTRNPTATSLTNHQKTL